MKKVKLTKPKKISTSLILFSTAILFILNLLSAMIMIYITGHGMNRKQDAFLQQTTLSAQKQVENFIDKYTGITEALANNQQLRASLKADGIETTISENKDFSDILETLNETMSKYPDILGIGIGSIAEDSIYNQDGLRLNVSLSARPYFSSASKSTYVTQPYIDESTGEMCISVASPIDDDKGLHGILIVDLKLAQLSEFLSQMSFGGSGHSILLSDDNTIVGYEELSIIGKNFSDLNASGDILSEIDSPSGKVIAYQISGEKRVGVMAELSNGGWKVLTSMSSAEYNSQTVKTILFLLILLMFVAVIVAVSLRHIIVKKLRPLSELNQGLKEISGGNLNLSISYRASDEIGEMADSMRSCISSLSSYVGEISDVMGRLASGDLTVKPSIEFNGDFIPIQRSISEFIDTLTQLIRDISQASDQVSSGAGQVSSGAQALAQGATEQASSVEELAATLSELSSTVKNNSEMARAASINANQVNNEIIESSEKMNHSLEVMEEIRTGAGKVSGIIKTIEDIAFQTNILALNAAVEAARAGQAGRGFAVVADEVRNLAAKSAEASKATTELIGGMVSSIEKGSGSMEQTKRYMDNVVANADEITAVFQKISAASEDQFTSISQVTQGTDQISSVVQTNSATAEQSAAASEELSSQALLLKEMIGKFKLTGSEPLSSEPQNNTLHIQNIDSMMCQSSESETSHYYDGKY